MPEGHTLHRLAHTLDRAFAGTTPRVTSPQGRFVAGAALLDGRACEGAQAWGKHLFVTFVGERILNVHLGLIGVFDVLRYAAGPGLAVPAPPAVGAVRMRLLTDEWVADLRGATVVEVVTPEQQAATLARLGPDPLRAGEPGQDPARSLAKLARTDRSIAELLMDQSVLAGVGNVYRCEVLHRHRVAPFTPGRLVKASTWLELWDDLVDLMPLGVAFGQIITLPEQVEEAQALLAPVRADGEAQASGEPAAYVVDWQGGAEGERGRGRGRSKRPAYEVVSPLPREYAVYKRTGEPCPRCGARVRSQVVAGRTLYWCGRCQRRR
ncbi:MAG TPA: zinc finger domain-containing protein [Phycicoccus sp.]|nr:zinc finger domain-containing protein [Phycicoccus sp.]